MKNFDYSHSNAWYGTCVQRVTGLRGASVNCLAASKCSVLSNIALHGSISFKFTYIIFKRIIRNIFFFQEFSLVETYKRALFNFKNDF